LVFSREHGCQTTYEEEDTKMRESKKEEELVV
jgi:hypothetical protein